MGKFRYAKPLTAMALDVVPLSIDISRLEVARVDGQGLSPKQLEDIHMIVKDTIRWDELAVAIHMRSFMMGDRKYVGIGERGTVMGYAYDTWISSGFLQFSQAMVHPQYRKQGVYTAIVRRRVSDAIKEGAKCIEVIPESSYVLPVIKRVLDEQVSEGALSRYIVEHDLFNFSKIQLSLAQLRR